MRIDSPTERLRQRLLTWLKSLRVQSPIVMTCYFRWPIYRDKPDISDIFWTAHKTLDDLRRKP